MCASEKKAMQCRPPKFTLLPNTGLPTALSDSSKAHQVVLKVPDTLDLFICYSDITSCWGGGGTKIKTMAEGLEPDDLQGPFQLKALCGSVVL